MDIQKTGNTKNVFSAGIIFSLFFLLYAFQVSAAPPFGSPDDVKYSENLWKALTEARLVGDQTISATPYKGDVHKTFLITLNSTVRVGNHTGKVIVKKMFQGDDVSSKNVANDPASYLNVVAVMYQREKGFDSKNQDWFWIKYNAEGTPFTNPKGLSLAGRVPKCITCHVAAKGSDLIYSND